MNQGTLQDRLICAIFGEIKQNNEINLINHKITAIIVMEIERCAKC